MSELVPAGGADDLDRHLDDDATPIDLITPACTQYENDTKDSAFGVALPSDNTPPWAWDATAEPVSGDDAVVARGLTGTTLTEEQRDRSHE